MFEDRDFQTDTALLEALERPYARREAPVDEPPVGQGEMIQDFELETLWKAMALDDPVVYVSARTAMLAGLGSVEQIRYRQAVLTDALAQPDVVREIYGLAVQAIIGEREIFRSSFALTHSSSALLSTSITRLEAFVPILQRLRALTDEHADRFTSKGFTQFFDALRHELDEDYFNEISEHLGYLRLRDGVLMSARLGSGGQGIGYVLRAPSPDNRRFRFRRIMLNRPTHSYTVPPRDYAGGQALGRLRDRGVNLAANALGQSTDHILSFFTALRTELGFYVGSLNLHDQLTAKREPECLPDPHPLGTTVWSAKALFDPCLSLRLPDRVQGNDLRADGTPLLVITGANQGGKSTFLRSLGLAQLMMQSGMAAPAESFAATVTTGVFTHYKREEDATMTSGKFDEELARMSTLVTAIDPGALLLCNESFAATNEREASEIADDFIHAMNDIDVKIVFVTHLYTLAHHYHRQHADTTVFLRAERGSDGQRPFRLTPAAPLPTSYGEDLYRRTFTETDTTHTDTPASQ
ncbi:DNA mismatch repair protein MutS [Arthrobacter livingstonensis]|uniref:DNA mismatch repair protein MutS n=2 Tax=Arthrobacter livingstonensis TaxID=670078 RepID=A0A2V5LTG9_9MICC|nr:DNA mismatch repair protein MutS [Arthrobacter livingstonensis]